MKDIKILLIIFLLCTSNFIYCGESISDQEYAFGVDIGSIKDNCCGVSYNIEINGVARDGGTYYYIALCSSDTIIKYGAYKHAEEGVFENLKLSINNGYIDSLPPSEYRMVVIECLGPDSVGDMSKGLIVGEVSRIEYPDYSGDECAECCTILSNPSKYYGGILKNRSEESNVLGARCEIKSVYGNLCRNIEVNAHTSAWCGIQTAIQSYSVWVPQIQAGIHIIRQGGITDTTPFFEYYPNNNNISELVNLVERGYLQSYPEEGTRHDYLAQYDTSNGLLDFRYDNIQYTDIVDTFRTFDFRFPSWRCEIEGRETDMMGTSNNKCEFKDCKFLLNNGSSWVNAYFGESSDIIGVTEPQGSEPVQWKMWCDTLGNFMKVWDLYPLEN